MPEIVVCHKCFISLFWSEALGMWVPTESLAFFPPHGHEPMTEKHEHVPSEVQRW